LDFNIQKPKATLSGSIKVKYKIDLLLF